MEYSLSPREIPWAKPEGFPKGPGYISLYFPTQVTIQTFSITTPALTFLGDQYWKVDYPYCSDSWVIWENITQQIGLIHVKEEGWTGFSEGWQGCSKGFPEGKAPGKS